jgi:hypothetical protein
MEKQAFANRNKYYNGLVIARPDKGGVADIRIVGWPETFLSAAPPFAAV